jgi:hypothetical protein
MCGGETSELEFGLFPMVVIEPPFLRFYKELSKRIFLG